jgi:hypothetical protein
MPDLPFLPGKKTNLPHDLGRTALALLFSTSGGDAHRESGKAFDFSEFGPEYFPHLLVGMMCVEECYELFLSCIVCPCRVQRKCSNGRRLSLLNLVAESLYSQIVQVRLKIDWMSGTKVGRP